jgi:sugar/nucleoside kinase (ribokinase family)
LSEGKSCLEAIPVSNIAAIFSVTRKGVQPSIPKINELS